MATFCSRLFSLAAALLLGAAVVQGQGESPANEKYLAEVRDVAQQLVRDLEDLQNAIVGDLSGQKERALYRQADVLLREAAVFRNHVKTGATRPDLYKHFEHLDPKFHDLVTAVRAVGPGQRALQRAVSQMMATDDQLHYVLSAGDTSPARARQVMERQAHALATTAQELSQTASYAVGDTPGRDVLLGDLKKFAVEAEKFQKRAPDLRDPKVLQAAFEPVSKAWGKVAQELKLLRPDENVYLLRSAVRADQLHERLFRLLGMKGDRPTVIIRT